MAVGMRCDADGENTNHDMYVSMRVDVRFLGNVFKQKIFPLSFHLLNTHIKTGLVVQWFKTIGHALPFLCPSVLSLNSMYQGFLLNPLLTPGMMSLFRWRYSFIKNLGELRRRWIREDSVSRFGIHG